jgi:DNA helicase-2/ATP-dependent DNA helicase PcrA
VPPSRAAPRPLSSTPSSRERASLPQAPSLPFSEAEAAPGAVHGRRHEGGDAPAGEHTLTLLSGAPGSGKTEQLVARALSLLENGTRAEHVLLLAPSRQGAAALAARIAERASNGEAEGTASSADDLPVHLPSVLSAQAFCARLLRSEAARAGVDPFFAIATRADRLSMLLARSRAAGRQGPRDGSGEQAEQHLALPATPAAALRAIERVDRLKAALLDYERYAQWAETVTSEDDDASVDAASFARLYREHERMLTSHGALDEGEILLRTVSLLREPRVAAGIASRHRHLLIDDLEDGSDAFLALSEVLVDAIADVTLAGDEHALRAPAAADPRARVVRLDGSRRCPPAIIDAARGALDGSMSTHAAAAPVAPAAARERTARPGEGPTGAEVVGDVAFWRCADERAEADAAVSEIERLIARGPTSEALSIGVLVRSLERDGRAVVGALKERAIPYHVSGGSELFESSEVRDLLAWLRLLSDPLDRNATIRLLTRPPVELRPVELARVVQLSRRRKLDMPSALAAALDAPQFPPEARERIAGFLGVYGELASELEDLRPEELVHRLIERAGLRRAAALAADEPGLDGLLRLSRVEEVAAHFSLLLPHASARELAAHLCNCAEAELSFEELVPGDAACDAQAAGTRVEVRSLDAVRGCEFDHVFVVGLDAELAGATASTPEAQRTADATAELLAERSGRAADDWPTGVGRSLYVALTRARRRVVLLHGARDGSRAPRQPLAAAEDARRAVATSWEDRAPAQDAKQALHTAARMVREQLLADVARIGGRLGELRLDTGEDISHGVVRYLELLKLAALLERPPGQSVADALPEVNARLLAACTPLERELLETSELDALLNATEHGGTELTSPPTSGPAGAKHASPVAAMHRLLDTPEDARLAAFLPRAGRGLVLSASDIESYRACPLRYKFARVLRIPAEPTPQQRFGIMVHKVLERYHSEWDGVSADGGSTLPTLMRLLDAAWRRAGFRESPSELALRERARGALVRYHQQLAEHVGRPVWFERSFTFNVGSDLVRGRVDRVDRLADDAYELIDYKTSHARTEAQLEGDIQLALYGLAAKRAWGVTAERLAYYYVLDNRKVPLAAKHDAQSLRAVEATITEVAEGIRALEFAPTPSYTVCSGCDFLSICPAAET